MSEIPAPYAPLHAFGKPGPSGVAPVYRRDFTRPDPPIIPLDLSMEGDRGYPAESRCPSHAEAGDPIGEVLDAALNVLDLGDNLLALLDRATSGKTAGLLAIHAAARWRHASDRLHRALDSAIGASRSQA